ncbi:glycine betaine ABC transporter substrate-binding protein [Halosolutus amylolyticus]|uniref:Glycine betaine ABC transporter substrate-binding protein n=1 Tax=Halosolutus amylolyticus TaxID=2932267 RepID=A0ABD5PJI9_9EURY|nr:glycine betaine ABC transporter substrate-binding protein [Halosolutus amylolyticus]
MLTQSGRRKLLKVTGTGAIASTAGCLSLMDSGGDVTVGGKEFTEQLILSYISIHMLENAGNGVEDSSGLGGSTPNHEGIVQGEIDHYWEYTGTALNHHLGYEDEKITDPDEQYQRVAEEYEDEHGIVWLDMAPFNNTYVVTANQEWQAETGVETLTGLAEHINDGNEVTWGVSTQYLDNPTALGDMPEFYGYEDSMDNVSYEEMSIGTINYRAVEEGEVDLGVGFETDPQLQQFDVGIVEDDETWFVVYYPAPLVREEALDDDVRKALNVPTEHLDTETMQQLNAEVAVDERDPRAVAEDWLESEGLL